VAVSLKGKSDTGPTTPAADAPLANDKDTPTNPRVGINSFRRFRVETCFVLGILHPPKFQKFSADSQLQSEQNGS
jgi:hypothetical protein